MKSRFRVEFKKQGIKYAFVYFSTIEKAMKTAISKGFDETFDSWSRVPFHAIISERDGDGWEPIASVDASGFIAFDYTERKSVLRNQNEILQAQNRITVAMQLQKQIESEAVKAECAATKTSVTQQHLTQQPSVQTV